MELNAYVDLKVAKALKDIGFNEYTQFIIGEDGLRFSHTSNNAQLKENCYSQPTYNEAADWLSKTFGIDFVIKPYAHEYGIMYSVVVMRSINEGNPIVSQIGKKAGFSSRLEALKYSIVFSIDKCVSEIPQKELKAKKLLFVVDPQMDFVSPFGALFVKNSESVPTRIASIVKDFDGVVITMDAHPWNHCSFETMGGKWPIHCVKNSSGASIPNIILESVCGKPTLYLSKGEDNSIEEYGALNYTNGQLLDDFIHEVISTDIKEKIDVYVCGVAGDYCVAETVSQMMKIKDLWVAKFYMRKINNVFLIKDLCPCINDDFNIQEFSDKNGVICITSDSLPKTAEKVTDSLAP